LFVKYHDQRLLEAEEDVSEVVEFVDSHKENDGEVVEEDVTPLVIYSLSEESDDDYIYISGREGYVINEAFRNDNLRNEKDYVCFKCLVLFAFKACHISGDKRKNGHRFGLCLKAIDR